MKKYLVMFIALMIFVNCSEKKPQNIQKNVDKIEILSYNPLPYKVLNWKQKALDYNEIVFDKKEGQYLPLSKIDSNGNLSMLAYVGDNRSFDGGQEAINVFAALLSGELVGKDETKYIDKLEGFYNKEYKIFTNNVGGKGGQTFWYEIFPNILYSKLYLKNHKSDTKMEARFKEISDSWGTVGEWLVAKQDLNYTSYDFAKKEGVILGWNEPDAAIGIAYLQLLAYEHFKDEKYLTNAKNLMLLVDKYPGNPFYEILTAYGPYTATVLNSKYGMSLNVEKYFNWLLNGDSDVRQGWGVMQGRWKDYDVSGLVGSVTDNGGYAFAMNTFATAEAISALPKYDARYANVVGKWLYNIVVNSRLFYRDGISKNNQNITEWSADTKFAIPFEGLRFEENGKIAVATGDAKKYNWAKTDFSLYSGSYSGFIANIYEETNDKSVMKFNLNANDYFSENKYPMYLYFNGSNDNKKTLVKLSEKSKVYDVTSKVILAENVEEYNLEIPTKSSIVIAIIPQNEKIKLEKNNVVADNNFVASSQNLALNIKNLNTDKSINGKVEIGFEATAENKIKKLLIEIDDEKLYSGKIIPTYSLDTTTIKNGTHDFKFTLVDKNGTTDVVERKVFIYNIGAKDSIISLKRDYADFEVDEISLMKGKGEKIDGKLIVTETNPEGGWGGVKIDLPKLNFDKKPSLVINVSKISKSWGMKLVRKGDEKNKWGFYILGDTSKGGLLNIDLTKALKTYAPTEVFQGEQEMELWIFAVGEENANITIDDLDLFYIK